MLQSLLLNLLRWVSRRYLAILESPLYCWLIWFLEVNRGDWITGQVKPSNTMGSPKEVARETRGLLASRCHFWEILSGVWSAEPPFAKDTAFALWPHEDLFGSSSCWGL